MCSRENLCRVLRLVLCLSPLILSGCATVFDGGPDNIRIDSDPNGARVTIYDEYGDVVASGHTMFKVALKAGGNYRNRSYRVKVEKLGFEPKEFLIEGKANGWWWGNLLYGGPLGAVVVDPITGDMWKLDPAEVEVKLEKIKIPEGDHTTTSLLILTPDELPAG
ncbi:MAG: hypothetical protein ACPGVU_15115 [Limisphaerales bacterium]